MKKWSAVYETSKFDASDDSLLSCSRSRNDHDFECGCDHVVKIGSLTILLRRLILHIIS